MDTALRLDNDLSAVIRLSPREQTHRRRSQHGCYAEDLGDPATARTTFAQKTRSRARTSARGRGIPLAASRAGPDVEAGRHWPPAPHVTQPEWEPPLSIVRNACPVWASETRARSGGERSYSLKTPPPSGAPLAGGVLRVAQTSMP